VNVELISIQFIIIETLHDFLCILSTSIKHNLDLETTTGTLTTSTLKLATLGTNERLLVLVGTHTKVLNGLTRVLGTTDEDSVGTSGGTESQLIQGQDFTTGLQDTGLGGLGEVESSNGDLGEVQKTGVVGDGTNNDNSLVTLEIADNTRDGDGGTVDAGHKETLQHNLVEVGIGTTSQEAVKLFGLVLF
jgi:hypothetical protein